MIIHPTAIIGQSARLGRNIIVGPYAVIEDETEIGDGCEIRAHAVVKRFTSLGSSNVVHEGAVLGGEPQDMGYRDCESFLRIGSGNRIREGVTMHRGTQPGSSTLVGSDCFFMAYTHVAHNCSLGNRVILANNIALAGHVTLQDQAFVSGGVVVHQFCRIGRLAMIGGNAKIVQDCLPFVTTDGNPGVACGLNLVGLKRAGISSADVQILKQAYRVLLRSPLSQNEALSQLTNFHHPLVDCWIEFVRTSKRGFCHE